MQAKPAPGSERRDLGPCREAAEQKDLGGANTAGRVVVDLIDEVEPVDDHSGAEAVHVPAQLHTDAGRGEEEGEDIHGGPLRRRHRPVLDSAHGSHGRKTLLYYLSS